MPRTKLILGLSICLSAASVSQGQVQTNRTGPTPLPVVEQWKEGPEVLLAESVAPLQPMWTVNLKSLAHSSTPPAEFGWAAGIALTDRVAVVSYCPASIKCKTGQLLSLDLKTGRLLTSAEFHRKAEDSIFYISGETERTVLVYDQTLLVEYDEALKPIHDLTIPRGMWLAEQPGYGYAYWADRTKTKCKGTQFSVYRLNEKRNLIVGCSHEVGVTDEGWQPLFSERYFDANGVGLPDFSQDGRRFILKLTLNYKGDPPASTVVSYLLYDLRGKSPRRIVFSTEGNATSMVTGLSPDGTTLGVIHGDRISAYTLPK